MRGAIIALAMLPSIAFADMSGRIVGVSDGDTVTILSGQQQTKVRLAGIDAPEKKQAFGMRSKQSLSDCAFDKQAIIEGSKLDKYKRLVGKVIVNGTDCNINQIQLGMAWHYKKYQKEQPAQDRASYASAEDAARDRKLGLWSDPSPTPPWEFRRR
jgi:endonuclease YncB( thermonuclease family)